MASDGKDGIVEHRMSRVASFGHIAHAGGPFQSIILCRTKAEIVFCAVYSPCQDGVLFSIELTGL